MKWRPVICGAVLAALLLTPAHGVQFTDTETHWAGKAIDRWSDCGVVSGYADGRFGPNAPITRAEMAVILSRVLGWRETAENRFSDLSGGEWYAADVLRANAAGVLNGSNGAARPLAPISRQEAAVMLSRAFRVSGSGDGGQYADRSRIGDWAYPAIAAMTGRGFITGTADGKFEPARTITRAETMVILDRIVSNYYQQAGTYTGASSGISVIAAPGVTLRDMEVKGDLLIAAGAAGSEVVLENVTVTGQTFVQSGEETVVLISGNSRLQRLAVEGRDARVQFSGAARAADLSVSGSGAGLRGLPEGTKVAVADGAKGVTVNGRTVSGTATAGADISEDWDDVIVEVEINTGTGGGSTPPPSAGETPPPDAGTGTETPGGGVNEDGNIKIDFGDLIS